MSGSTNDLRQKTPVSSKIGYALGAAACCFSLSLTTYMTFFMTQNLAIPILSASLMIMIVKILDGVTDIIAGFIIDKTKSSKGKARPWFLRASIPFGICMALIFFVPATLPTTTKLILVGVLYALTVSIFGTLLGVARYAIIPRITNDLGERGTYSALGDGVLALVVGVVMTVTLPMSAAIGWKMTYSIFAAVAVVCALVCYALTKEMSPEEIHEMAVEKISFKDLLKSLLSNKYALFLLIYILVQQISQGIIQLAGTYYFTYVIGDINLFSTMMLLSMVFAVIGIIVSKFVMNKTTKLFGYGCVIAAILLFIMWLFGSGDRPLFVMIVMAITLLFSVTIPTLAYGMMSSMAVDYGEWKSGTRSDGLTSSMVNLGIKIGSAIGTALIGAILAGGGFVEGGAAQSASALAAIKNGYLLIPAIILAVIAVFFFLTFHLGKQMPEIRADLAKRHEAAEES